MQDLLQKPGEGSALLERDVAQCPQHYWLLEEPLGPTSTGVCKQCGTTKEFPNATQDRVWDSDLTATWLANSLMGWKLPPVGSDWEE